jgi:hypothetical protein
MKVKVLTKEQNGTKTISFETLQKLSDCNVKRLNRNIDVELLLSGHSNINSHKVELKSIMTHCYHLGKLTDPHKRCLVMIERIGCVGIQDVFNYQWESLN